MDESLKRQENAGRISGSGLAKKLPIFLLIIVLAGTAAVFGGYYLKTGKVIFGLAGYFSKPEVEQMLPLESFVVNLKDEKTNHYLKTTLTLSYCHDKDRALIEQRLPQIRDAAIQYFRGLSRSDISAAKNLEAYRQDLLARVNGLFDEEIVMGLYFTEFIIQ